MLLPAVLTAAALAAGGPAVDATPAAAPRIIMFYGGQLGDQRVYMVDWYENLAFMLATLDSLTTVPPEYRGGRHVDIAMYWHGPTWEAHARDTTLLKTLRPEQGQRSRLYLATPASPAFIESKGFIKYRMVSDSAQLILRKYGVPTR